MCETYCPDMRALYCPAMYTAPVWKEENGGEQFRRVVTYEYQKQQSPPFQLIGYEYNHFIIPGDNQNGRPFKIEDLGPNAFKGF